MPSSFFGAPWKIIPTHRHETMSRGDGSWFKMPHSQGYLHSSISISFSASSMYTDLSNHYTASSDKQVLKQTLIYFFRQFFKFLQLRLNLEFWSFIKIEQSLLYVIIFELNKDLFISNYLFLLKQKRKNEEIPRRQKRNRVKRRPMSNS